MRVTGWLSVIAESPSALLTCWLLLRACVCPHGVCVQYTTCDSTVSGMSYSGPDCTGTATTVGPVATNTCNVEANGSSDLVTCSGAAALTAGISPSCSYGCPGCQVQPSLAAYQVRTLEVISCGAQQAFSMRHLSFIPMCNSATDCSKVSLSVSLPGNIVNSDVNNCFRDSQPGQGWFANSGQAGTLTVTVRCNQATPCLYASIVDIVCVDNLAGHTASGK